MKVRLILFLLLAAFLSAGTIVAGQLSPDLASRAKLSPDSRIRVWIKLYETDEVRALRTLPATAATAVERHKQSIETLKRAHRDAQSDLNLILNLLITKGQAADRKSHWLINVVEIDVDANALEQLAAHPSIESIVAEPTITLIRPTYESAASVDAVLPDSVVDNLKHIKAPAAWAQGYTGAGRVVCSFDTGIEGTHPGLQASWRGRGGSRQDSLASWFDPKFKWTYPHTLPGSLSPQHGTHTMGIMVGRDTVNDITYGVAPDAKWISAGVIDLAGASILDAFEWAADPDGDPNTISDLPDVINHSWGYREDWVGCENIVFDMVDATEALGIVNIFSAGNSGPSGTTIYNPANRANDSIDCFAVGMINNATPPTVDLQSSRGPSGCNGAIKPNVVAPGVFVWSTIPGAKYGAMTGTSMAAPHVAGLVALIRQKKPSATVDEIKTAILNTTQRYSWSVPNNNQGWGEINCEAALNAISTTVTSPNVRLHNFTHNTILPGATVTGKVVVQNLGSNVNSLTGSIVGTHPLLSILDGSVSFGTVSPNVVDTSTGDISVVISDTVTNGTIITVPFTITNGSYTTNTSLAFLVEPRVSKSIATHVTSRLQFSVSNFGVYGMGSPSIFPIGGQGFNFDGLGNDFWECGLMMATGVGTLVSGVHDQLYEPEMDFKVAPGGDMQFDTLAGPIIHQSYSRFNDANAANPIGIEITQQTYTFADPYEDLVLIRYILKNRSGATVSNLRVGLHLDWDILSYSRNAGGWDAADQFLWMGYNTTNSANPVLVRFRGAKLVEGPLATAATSAGRIAWVGWEDAAANGLLATEKYSLLTAGMANLNTYKDSLTDLFQTLAAGPLSLTAGQADTLVFAILGGTTLEDIQSAAAKSVLAYGLIGGQAPTSATLITPAQNEVISDLLPTFVWNESHDPNPGDVVTYTLRYGTDPTLTSATSIADLNDTTHTLIDSLNDGTNYYWRVIATDNGGMSSMSSIRQFSTDISTDVPDDGNGLPRSFALYQNYPNPFNPVTIIAFDLPRASDYSLTVYDISGRRVFENSGSARAGRVELEWDGSGQGSGVYLYRLTAGQFVSSRKMLLLK